jgi:hypothetical protein
MRSIAQIHVKVIVAIIAIAIVLPALGLLAEGAVARVDLATQEDTHR